MALSQDYIDFLMDQLSGFGEVSYKKMFGGAGFYKDGVMFGGIMYDELHFKVDDETRPLYEERGMKPFAPGNKKTKGLPLYYCVPVEVVEDRDELARWASRALKAAKGGK
ncbi:MAG: TfoX/Sxy family protein [Phaeodactylibacter sp.]|nr:TfoX/Sxy family protein [Phaeodactylibacter sp.]MCB9051969.1 TfoX/Sxy family protein [Lewinellaceae bacterium]